MNPLQDKIQALTPARRESVDARATALIAEEVSREEMRRLLGATQGEPADRMDIDQEGDTEQP